MNKYEAMFIVKPDLSEDDRKTLFSQMSDAVTKGKGEVLQAAVWAEKRKLGFRIKKCDDGVYYLMKFSMPADALVELRNVYKLNENILRVLITRQEQ